MMMITVETIRLAHAGLGLWDWEEEILVSKYLGDGVGILGYRYKPEGLPGSGVFAYDHPAILSVD